MRSASYFGPIKINSFIYFGVLLKLRAIQNHKDPSSESLSFSEEGWADVRVSSSYYSNFYGRA